VKSAAITIAIAGIPIRFSMNNAALAARIRKRYAGWITTDERPDITFRCTTVKKCGSDRSSLPNVMEATPDRGQIKRTDFECCWDQGRGTIALRASVYSFDACLRVLLSALLPRQGGLLLHASAVASAKTGGYVFAGRSGSGKTTIARLLDKAIILNDELCTVRMDKKQGVMVNGTPFWGEMRTGPAHPESFRLAGLYFLKKAPCTVRERLAGKETFMRLLGCVCSFTKKTEETERILCVAERIVALVPAYDLYFRRSAEEVADVALCTGDCRAA
jgi:hypothetical protein